MNFVKLFVRKVPSAHHADCDDNIEKFTEEEVESVFVELVVNVLHE